MCQLLIGVVIDHEKLPPSHGSEQLPDVPPLVQPHGESPNQSPSIRQNEDERVTCIDPGASMNGRQVPSRWVGLASHVEASLMMMT